MTHLRVAKIIQEAVDIRSYELVSPDRADLPRFTPGAHIDVHLPTGEVRQYSLTNDEKEKHRYEIAVLRQELGQGGSKALYDNTRIGDSLDVSHPRNNFPLSLNEKHFILIAGGIGITPILAMSRTLVSNRKRFDLHYCAREPERAAYVGYLNAISGSGTVHFHYDGGDPAKGLDTKELLKNHTPGQILYCCGPGQLLDAVATASQDWPEGAVNFEYFAPPEPVPGSTDSSLPFHVKIASTGQFLAVPNGKSILTVLEENGVSVESSCESGTCGTCRTRYIEGEPDHNDYVLTRREREEYVMICCARSKSPVIVLDI